jgi:hypothetical protein
MKKFLVQIVGCFFFALFLFYFYSDWQYMAKKTTIVVRAEGKLQRALYANRRHIKLFSQIFGEYPVLKSENINFWNYRTNQYIWLRTFEGIPNVATNPIAINQKEGSWKAWNEKQGKMTPPNEEKIKEFFNPLTGKFDWLAEDASGNLYSRDMPDSVLMASPPIRVVNIRCPLTASDPPFYEDFTKW